MKNILLTILIALGNIITVPSYAKQDSLGRWQPLKNQPTFLYGANNPLLLTDGSVIVHSLGTPEIWKLTPDIHGSYVRGTWSQLASLPDGYIPLYHASAILADGRLIYEGGEYNGADFKLSYTNLGAIYDPIANFWTPVLPPPFFISLFQPPPVTPPNAIGDAQSVVLFDGTFMLAGPLSTQAALLDLKTLTWTETGSGTKMDVNDEEGWTLLPNGKVLTIDVADGKATNSEIYDPETGSWHPAGNTIVSLTDPNVFEMGPAVLRPNGTVFAVGSNGNTSIYEWCKQQWTVGPRLPLDSGTQVQLGVQDGPGALLPNGHVLFAASPIPIKTPYSPGMHIFEFDGCKLIEQPTIPNAAVDPAFAGNMLILPTGQILMTDQSNDVEIFTSGDASYNPCWAPTITCAPKEIRRKHTYKIEGILFNGMSQGSAYGDDYQSATNYPLVRITNLKTKHVFYARTHDHSSMAVASDKCVHTYFDVPRNIEKGKSKLEVIANGIPSKPICIRVK